MDSSSGIPSGRALWGAFRSRICMPSAWWLAVGRARSSATSSRCAGWGCRGSRGKEQGTRNREQTPKRPSARRDAPMDLGLDEQQELLKNFARDFLEKECPESVVREMEEDEKGYSPDLWRKMAQQGWMGLIIPEEYGGAGMQLCELVVLLEEFGRALVPGPDISTVVLGGLPGGERGAAGP